VDENDLRTFLRFDFAPREEELGGLARLADFGVVLQTEKK
jgi:hypothetical protein